MSIDRSVVNFETLGDAEGLNGSSSGPKKAKTAGFGKKNQGPFLKGGKGGKGPSSKVSKATKTSGKFGKSREGHVQGKGNNSKIR